MKTSILFLIVGIFVIQSVSFSVNLPIILNERGDTINYSYPPPDSTYIHNKLIIRFRPNALNLNLLCFNFNNYNEKKNTENQLGLTSNQKAYLLNQKFSIDYLVSDTNLRNAIKSFGGDTLKRLTTADPCVDTTSITRYGDTIRCNDFLWMLLYFDNDTSVIQASIFLTYYFQSSIILAEPDYLLPLHRSDPSDGLYNNQISLHSQLTDTRNAWNYEVSSRDIKVGIIDNGIYYYHCDLGGDIGIHHKVVGGWDYTDNQNNPDISRYANHGTHVAGIIGALTNHNCTADAYSVAGIAGGWWPGYDDESTLGCQLFGWRCVYGDCYVYCLKPFDVKPENMVIVEDMAISAILEASSYNPNLEHGLYGYGIHILNNSWGGGEYSEALRAAIKYAFENGVSFVASRGNTDYGSGEYWNINPVYPSSYDDSWVTSVGGSNHDNYKCLISYSGGGMDLIAPSGLGKLAEQNADPIVFTTIYNYNLDDTRYWHVGYDYFSGTSASAPHVSGCYALLRTTNPSANGVLLEPEDYEGMIKASAMDMNQNNVPNYDYNWDYYKVGYDLASGWGSLKIGPLYDMINLGYRVYHYPVQNLSFGSWGLFYTCYFYNDGRKNKTIETGAYYVQRREVTGSITLPNQWVINNMNHLYVWGRSGRGAFSGLSAANPNYQTGYTEVTSGTGGNNYVPGIIHDQSLTVSIRTYQYQLYSGLLPTQSHYLGIFPSNNLVGGNISVFGLLNTSDVKKDIDINASDNYNLYPNPSTNNIAVKMNFNEMSIVHIVILDPLGKILIDLPPEQYSQGVNVKNIDLSFLDPGVYICKLNICGIIKYLKFVMIK